MLNKKQVAKLQELIEEYAQDAAHKYYMDDQGCGKEVDHAQEHYDVSKAALEEYIKSISWSKKG